MKTAVLYSGGKDSNRALHWALENDFDVRFLVTMFPRTMDSLMFHTPALNLVELSSRVVGIPLMKGLSSREKEEEIKDVKNTVNGLDVDCLVSGTIKITYQKNRVERLCQTWHHDHTHVLTHAN